LFDKRRYVRIVINYQNRISIVFVSETEISFQIPAPLQVTTLCNEIVYNFLLLYEVLKLSCGTKHKEAAWGSKMKRVGP
jgi:hypothetical protein